MVRLAWSINVRPGRHGPPLVARTVPQILGAIVQTASPPRPARDASEIRRLIERLVSANPLWRAPRIHSELKMLGVPVSERTVSRNSPDPPSPAHSDLEDLSPQPRRSYSFHGFLYCAEYQHEGSVRVPRTGTSTPPVLHFNVTKHPRRPGPLNRLLRLSPKGGRPDTSFEIGTVSTVTMFVCGSRHSA